MTASDKEKLIEIVKDFHWMARRYADQRSSYAVGLFNGHTRWLLSQGIKLNSTGDETIWARDKGGRSCDGLSDQEAIPSTPEAKGLRP